MSALMKRPRSRPVRISYDAEDSEDRIRNVGSDREGSSSNWREQFELLEQMRAGRNAPVDTMGCEMLADQTAQPKEYRFQTLLSLMLSSQTKDQITAAAMKRLKEHGCTVRDMIAIDTQELEQLLIPVGFYKRKASYIKKSAVILEEKYDGDIPNTVEKLCELPGVGEKMAYLTMQIAWNKMVGLGVDTHVHRISNRLGWVKTKTPKETRIALESLIPRTHWERLNKLLVGFGQQICLPVSPKCSNCLLTDNCPTFRLNKKI